MREKGNRFEWIKGCESINLFSLGALFFLVSCTGTNTTGGSRTEDTGVDAVEMTDVDFSLDVERNDVGFDALLQKDSNMTDVVSTEDVVHDADEIEDGAVVLQGVCTRTADISPADKWCEALALNGFGGNLLLNWDMLNVRTINRPELDHEYVILDGAMNRFATFVSHGGYLMPRSMTRARTGDLLFSGAVISHDFVYGSQPILQSMEITNPTEYFSFVMLTDEHGNYRWHKTFKNATSENSSATLDHHGNVFYVREGFDRLGDGPEEYNTMGWLYRLDMGGILVWKQKLTVQGRRLRVDAIRLESNEVKVFSVPMNLDVSLEQCHRYRQNDGVLIGPC